MARIVVIGGSGHVGTYLVPALVGRGHEVTNVSRGKATPYTPHAAWDRVREVTLDRGAAEADGSFAGRIADLNPDVVVDMIAFHLPQTQGLVEALRGRVEQFLHCSTIWVYGHNTTQPSTEDEPMNPFGDYGTGKAEIEAWLLADARRTGFPATAFRPGHIVGPGWAPLNPAGNFNTEVFAQIARGEELALPNFGLETVHHVHAADVARVILCAMTARPQAVGEAFNAVSAQAVTLRGYAEAMFRFFGHEPRLSFQPYEQWKTGVPEADAAATWEHIARSPCHSVDKGRTWLGYHPAYSSLAGVEEAVRALIVDGTVAAPAGWT